MANLSPMTQKKREVRSRGPFVIETTTEEGGHTEHYIFHRGRLIHKRWNPGTEQAHSKTFYRWGLTH